MSSKIVMPDGSEAECIHFVLVGGGRPPAIACMPGLVDLSGAPFRPTPHLRSEVAAVTTCPMCKETPEWRDAATKTGVPLPAAKPLFVQKPKAAPVVAPLKG